MCLACRERKHALELLLQRTPQQEAEEDVLLEEARVIEDARRQEDAQRRANAPSGSSPLLAAGHILCGCRAVPPL